MKVIWQILPKIGCHGNVPKGIIRRGADRNKNHANTFHLVKKIVKIGPVDHEIIWLKLKNEVINASKIYSPVGKCSEWAKLRKVKLIYCPVYKFAKRAK